MPTMTENRVPIGLISRYEGQPRKHFDQAGIEGLAASIAINGLLQPLVLRPDPDDPERYKLVAGERRWRALNLLMEGGEIDADYEVPYLIRERDEDDLADDFMSSVAENTARADMTIIEEAKAFQELLDRGWKIEAVARGAGKVHAGGKPNVQYIKWRLDLLSLIPEAMTAAEKGDLKPDLAWHTARLKPDQQAMMIRRLGSFESQREAINMAIGIHKANQQMALIDDGETDQQREERRTLRRHSESTMDRVGKLAEALHEIATTDPAKLAMALEGRTTAMHETMTSLADLANKARNAVGKAVGIEQAIADAGGREAITEDAS